MCVTVIAESRARETYNKGPEKSPLGSGKGDMGRLIYFYLDILPYIGIFYNKDFPKKLGRNVFSVDSCEKAVKRL